MTPKYENHPQHISELIEAALAAADPAAAVRRHLRREGRHLRVGGRRFDLEIGRVYLVGLGKASVPMGLAAAEILGDALTRGILVTKQRQEPAPGTPSPEIIPGMLSLMVGGHPISTEESVRAAAAVTALLEETAPGDLLLCLVSGGASALFASPMIPLAAWQHLNQLLLESGCTINELNLVRRRLDRVKGGGLARLAAPAACASLILSDVIGNPLEVIGSGPTVLTNASARAAIKILERYGIDKKLDRAAWAEMMSALEAVKPGKNSEPPPPHHVIIADVRGAAEAAVIRAAQLGFIARLLTARLQGEAREVARVAGAIAKDLPPAHCLVLAGETTVTVRGAGFGGRNQELALAAAIEIDGWPGTVISAFATDGEDGRSSAAGAISSGDTAAAGRRLGLEPHDFLRENDSSSYYEKLESYDPNQEDELPQPPVGGLIRTGPTGTNVNDLLFILKYAAESGLEKASDFPGGRSDPPR